MQLDQIHHKLDLVYAEMRSLNQEMHAEGGFLVSDPRYLRLKSLWAEEDRLEDELLKLDFWEESEMIPIRTHSKTRSK